MPKSKQLNIHIHGDNIPFLIGLNTDTIYRHHNAVRFIENFFYNDTLIAYTTQLNLHISYALYVRHTLSPLQKFSIVILVNNLTVGITNLCRYTIIYNMSNTRRFIKYVDIENSNSHRI